ncbi:uncharacterized protein LOC122016449 [Zingiber officinale]|uniref:rRNA methyltransferase 1, mitochondrial n=1 Tax=Zingiber officinale TaxID=94328 RepID=A0A8J5IHK0_ZINOF|nr:uncharacterized protein LOC122016449 [Zingiber officinale]KAG6535369.1 hypothetical protein ZIOFF_000335 [Zingiber officinale]
MHQCQLAKASVIPFLSKISKPGSRHPMVSICFSEDFIRRIPGSRSVLDVRSFSCHFGSRGSACGWQTRVFSSSSRPGSPEFGGNAKTTESLPWIRGSDGNKGGKRVQERAPAGTKRSSWAEAAESFLARDEQGIARKDNTIDAEEEDLEAEPVDDPRWDKIKSRYKDIIGREPQFEKQKNQHWSKNASWERKPIKGAEESSFNTTEVRRWNNQETAEVRLWNNQENWGRKTWKEATDSSVPKMVGQSVYGVGPVLAALTAERREFYALYVQEGLDLSGNNKKKKDKKAVERILKIAEKVGLKVVEASKHDLNMVVDNRPHQGLILDASPLEMVSIRELDPVMPEAGKSPLWLALDEVTDPQNLGAIIRSAYFFGAEGVVLCAKNSAPLSGVVSKASAGSLELIELLSCKNMMQFLSSSAENGWRVLGGSVSSKAVSLSEVEVGVPTILVLGSEGSGLRPLVERSCTQLIRIPGSFPSDAHHGTPEVDVEEKDQDCFGRDLKSFLAVESLNVSVAAGVLLYQLTGKNNHDVRTSELSNDLM